MNENEYLVEGQVCIRMSKFVKAGSQADAEKEFTNMVKGTVNYEGLTDSIEITGLKSKVENDN
jgi:hypothetical protein